MRNGVQNPPPPLNSLDVAADFGAVGATRTTTAGFNGADWQRHIIWRKGAYFLFLDRIVAREPGDYRLENRWRVRGEAALDGGAFAVRQGDKSFFILSADGAPRALKVVPDDVYSRWDYPYGPAATTVCLATRRLALAAGASSVFANLMYATAGAAASDIELRRGAGQLYVVDGGGRRDFVGLDARLLEKAGLATDASFFVQSSGRLYLYGWQRIGWGKLEIDASSGADLELDLSTGGGRLLVSKETDFALRGARVEAAGAESGSVGTKLHLKPGKYGVTLVEKPAGEKALEPALSGPVAVVRPEMMPTAPVDFGFEVANRVTSPQEITASCADGDSLLFGTKDGSIYRLESGKSRLLFALPSGKSVGAIRAADINGDGRREIVSSDSASHLFCHDPSGALLWKLEMTPFYGRNASATGIEIDDIDGRGAMTILVGTIGWKLYAVRPDGTVRWEGFVYYHPLTKIKVLKNKSRTVIAVGTIYQTPLDVVDPATGVVIWKTWEQTGSETMSTTDYCGKSLRDMVFIDTDGDGEKEIVFGNESHSLYALGAVDGRTKWKAQVDDKVSVMRLLGAGGASDERIMAATEAGEVSVFDRQGRRQMRQSLGSGITGMEVLSYASSSRQDVLLSTEDGRLAVYDDAFVPRASVRAGIGPIKNLLVANDKGNKISLYAVGGRDIVEVSYKPYFRRLSRHY